MLSVIDRIELVEVAESYAAERKFQELIPYLEACPPDILASDTTLKYLVAYGSFMTGREAYARRLLDTLWTSLPNVNDRLYRRVLNLRGIVEIELGNLRRAINLLADLRALSEASGDNRYIAYSTLNRGIAFDIMAYPQRAIAELQRARLSFQRLGDMHALAGCAHNLGMCFRKINCFHAAESEFTVASDHFAKHGSKEEAIATTLERALTFAFAGDAHIAESSATRALEKAEQLENKRLCAEGLRVLGSIAVRVGDHLKAKQLLTDALEVGTGLGITLLRAEVLVELARVASVENRREDALNFIEAASQAYASVGAAKRARELSKNWRDA